MKTIKFMLLFFSLSIAILAQTDDFNCPTPELVNESNMSWSYPLFGPTGTLKILVVYCKFSDDNFNLSPHTDLWPSTHNSMPDWGPSMISQTVQSNYFDPSISGYFQDMSVNSFQIIGESRFYQPLYEQSHYWISNGKHIGYLAEEVLTEINSSIDYSQFDQWDPYDIDGDGIKNESDGQVDYIALCFRIADVAKLDGRSFNGIASLTGDFSTFGNGNALLNLDGKVIRAGAWGSGSFHVNVVDPNQGLDVIAHEFGHYLFGGTHYSKIGFHGLMGAKGNGVMSSFERYKLGWIQPVLISTDSPNNYLTDAITTGVAKKININSSEYFLVDNHQRLSYYESSYKQYNEGPLRSPGTGVLITHCTFSTIDVESMFGRWNWKKTGNLYLYPFEVETVNRITGEDKMDLYQKSTNAGLKTHADNRGSIEDFMNPGYVQIFSPWSNPSTYPDATNICIELLEIDTNKIARVNIYTQNAILQAPSKPQNPRLLGSPKFGWVEVRWDGNLESDVNLYEVSRMVPEYGNYWSVIGTTTNTYFRDTEMLYAPGGGLVTPQYHVRAKDTQNKYSVYSDIVQVRAEPLGKESVISTEVKEYELSANYPNPFNPSTVINYAVKEAGLVKLNVYDILGAEVAELVNETKEAGNHSVEFNASQLPSGIYIYKLQAGDFVSSKKMILIK